MHIRTFRAASLQDALADIRQQMGPDASVLHTRQVRGRLLGLLGRTEVEVTAGLREPGDKPPMIPVSNDPGESDRVPQDSRSLRREGGLARQRPTHFAAPTLHATGDDASDANGQSLQHCRDALIRGGAAPVVANRWIASAASFSAPISPELGLEDGDTLADQLKRAVAREINLCGPIRTQPGERHVVALVGPTGVGKTTTIAKLAAGFRIEARRRVGLLTIDTYRIAAVQQLKAYAEIMDLPMRVVEKPDQMAAAMDELGDVDLVLIDTAGRSPRSDARVEQLGEFLVQARPDETHLVLSVTSSHDNIERALRGFSPVRPTSVILTKLDETPHTAGALSALTAADRALAMPISYITCGQSVPDDIAVADSAVLLRELLPELTWDESLTPSRAA
ncbi:MAG: flagellar biosynthesis protein FlhF [Planctomycetota bacterium]